MKIVVLDGHTMNPGDLDWGELRALTAQCEIYDRSAPEDVLSRAADAELVLVNKVELRRASIEQLPRLRYIGVLATGYNIVDLDAARERGIVVCNVPAYSTPSVAQTVFAFILEHCQQLARHAQVVRAGQWRRSPDFAFWLGPLTELAGKNLGIIGLGRIGLAVAELGRAFGMNVLASSRSQKTDAPAWIRQCDQETLLCNADFISLHCPLTPATTKMINAESLAMMRPTAFLVNTSRGGVIDEDALAAALHAGRLGGAGLDVLSQEPPAPECPLLAAPNCLITPHYAWATHEARERLYHVALDNVRAFLAGKPQNTLT
jgi:glycerate dehydrogenase